MVRRSGRWLSRRNRLPTSVRAVFAYYADTGVLDYRSLLLKRRVDDTVDEFIQEAFGAVEADIADAFDRNSLTFDYDTKLILPAKLTLGYLYRHLDESRHDEAEGMTQLAIDALLDGDMRDAINDDEFDDFHVDFDTSPEETSQVAEIAQATLQNRVEKRFEAHPDPIRQTYDWAVDISERHQDEDDGFREILSNAQAGEDGSLEAIRTAYRDVSFEDRPAVLTDEQCAFPYVKTQYDRVGVIYDAMIDMYREAGLPIDDSFQRSVVLAIIGAQIWLDDVDDYAVDMEHGQLTPVTAEYLLAEGDNEAYRSVVDIASQYLAHAIREATNADSALTGIATEYIYLDGTPEELPGAGDDSNESYPDGLALDRPTERPAG